MDRVPRTRIRIKLSELQPGEWTWVRDHEVKVLENGRAFFRTDGVVFDIYYDSWQRGPLRDQENIIKRTEDGFELHVLAANRFGMESMSEFDKDRYTRFDAVVLHEEDIVPCPQCQGTGLDFKHPRSTDVEDNVLEKLLKVVDSEQKAEETVKDLKLAVYKTVADIKGLPWTSYVSRKEVTQLLDDLEDKCRSMKFD